MRPGDSRPAEPLVEQLSRREREILALLAQGYTGPEIAEKLTIALSSVRSHLQNLYGKLGVDGKRSALNRAKQQGHLTSSLKTVRILNVIAVRYCGSKIHQRLR